MTPPCHPRTGGDWIRNSRTSTLAYPLTERKSGLKVLRWQEKHTKGYHQRYATKRQHSLDDQCETTSLREAHDKIKQLTEILGLAIKRARSPTLSAPPTLCSSLLGGPSERHLSVGCWVYMAQCGSVVSVGHCTVERRLSWLATSHPCPRL